MRCAHSESSRNSTLFKQEVARGEVSTSRSRRGSEVFKLVDRRYSFPNAGVANHHGSSQLHAVNASIASWHPQTPTGDADTSARRPDVASSRQNTSVPSEVSVKTLEDSTCAASPAAPPTTAPKTPAASPAAPPTTASKPHALAPASRRSAKRPMTTQDTVAALQARLEASMSAIVTQGARDVAQDLWSRQRRERAESRAQTRQVASDELAAHNRRLLVRIHDEVWDAVDRAIENATRATARPTEYIVF